MILWFYGPIQVHACQHSSSDITFSCLRSMIRQPSKTRSDRFRNKRPGRHPSELDRKLPLRNKGTTDGGQCRKGLG